MLSKNSHVLSFKYAFEGLVAAFKEEPKLKIHIGFGIIVILVSFWFQISQIEWLIIIAMIGFVISVELTNTAIEAVVDSFTEKEHAGAKLAKDISAAAVLVSAITAALIGLVIFSHYLLK